MYQKNKLECLSFAKISIIIILMGYIGTYIIESYPVLGNLINLIIILKVIIGTVNPPNSPAE
jgi:hypothetical protein